MSLIIIIPRLDGGGLSRVFLNLIHELTKNKIDIDLVLRFADQCYAEEVKDEARVWLPRVSRILDFLFLIFVKMVQEKSATIITAGEDLSCFVVFANLILAKKHRVIVTTHSNIGKAVLARGKSKQIVYLQFKVISFFYKMADGLVAVSRGAADNLKKVLHLSDSAVDVIYNPVVVDGFGDLCRAFSAPRTECDKFVIVYVGRLAKEKRLDKIVKSYALVLRALPLCKLWIVGEGPERESIEQVAVLEGCREGVDFFGFQKNPFPFIRAADVLVLASEWEGFGNVLVEALACGTNVVSYNCPSGPEEILESGKYGCLVNEDSPEALADALVRQLVSPLCSEDVLTERGGYFSARKSAESYLAYIK